MPHDLSRGELSGVCSALVADSSLGLVVFEVGCDQSGQLEFRVASRSGGRASRFLDAAISGMEVTATTTALPAVRSVDFAAPATGFPMGTVDPTVLSQQLLSFLVEARGVAYQVIVGRRLRPRRSSPTIWPALGLGDWLRQLALGSHELDASTIRSLREYAATPRALVNVRLVDRRADRSASHWRMLSLQWAGALASTNSVGRRQRLRPRSAWSANRLRRDRAQAMNGEELARLLGWPVGATTYPGLARQGAAAAVFHGRQSRDRVIGTAQLPGGRPVGIAASDGLRHTHLIGPTGVGKSTLMLRLILQDIAAGRGGLVLDPKGDLVDDLLTRIPPSDRHRIVLIDPTQRDHIVGFNPLAGSDPEVAVDSVVHVFASLNKDSWGPRTQDIFHSAMLTLARAPQHRTLTQLPQLLHDDRLRRKLTAGIRAGSPLAGFWAWYEALSPAERANVIAPLMNKLRPFLLRPSLQAMLSTVEPAHQPSSVFNGRIWLVPLRKGGIGPIAANLFGSLVLAEFWQATLNRSKTPAAERSPVFFYLDEFQDYLRLPLELSDVLAQARGLGVGLVLANQHFHQLPEKIRASVLANAQNTIAFRLGETDARLAAGIGELRPLDFNRLPAFEAYARLLEDGQRLPWARIDTMPPPQPATTANAAEIASALAARLGVPAQNLDNDPVDGSDQPDDDWGPIGGRERPS